MLELFRTDAKLWKRLVDSHVRYIEAISDLVANASDIVALIDYGLSKDRVLGLRLAELSAIEVRQSLLRELLEFAAYTHGRTVVFRNVIVDLPRDWLVANIERIAEPILERNDFEEYLRLLEVYYEIDPALTRRLAERAAKHSDPDISEWGDHFLEILKADETAGQLKKD